MRVSSCAPLGGCSRVWFTMLRPTHHQASLSGTFLQTLPELVMPLFISVNLSKLCQNWLCHWRGTLYLCESVQTPTELVMPLFISVNLSKLFQNWLCHWRGLFISVNPPKLCQNWLWHWRGTLYLCESVQTLTELVMPLFISVNLSILGQNWLRPWRGILSLCESVHRRCQCILRDLDISKTVKTP